MISSTHQKIFISRLWKGFLVHIIETHYRANFDRLSKQWGRRFDNPTVGQDVVQEAYLRAIKYLHTYDVSQKFDNWFGRVLHNSYKDFRAEEQGHSHDEIDEFSMEGIENHHEVDRLLKQIVDKIDELENKLVQTVIELDM